MIERRCGSSMGGNSINSVFYAHRYHPIQAGSIDGTDILPHDNAVYRAHLCSSATLYNPFGDPKVTGDPYCTLFVGRLNHLTHEDTLLKVMSKYGRVKNLRLVRHIVTGASRGYAFVEFESDKEMRRAYEDAHHSFIDDHEIIVDYNRQQLMPGWIPRRLGGGLGGKKESGQLRFGGRERPFRAPLRPIPFNDLKRLGISPPPEGRYMSRFQVPPPPKRKRGGSSDREERPRTSSVDREESIRKRSSMDRDEPFNQRRSVDKDGRYYKRPSTDREEQIHKRSSIERGETTRKRRSEDRVEQSRDRSSTDVSEHNGKKSSRDSEERSHKRHRHSSHSHRQERKWPSSRDHS